jgi:hypothetical protein
VHLTCQLVTLKTSASLHNRQSLSHCQWRGGDKVLELGWCSVSTMNAPTCIGDFQPNTLHALNSSTKRLGTSHHIEASEARLKSLLLDLKQPQRQNANEYHRSPFHQAHQIAKNDKCHSDKLCQYTPLASGLQEPGSDQVSN